MELSITSCCRIADNKVILNDRLIFYQENIAKFADFVKSAIKQEQIAYPKFYKMDAISKLGFLTSELVLREKSIKGYLPERVGIVFSNSSSSLDTDLVHQGTIKDRSAYFPSPSVFVYTLPNIVIGEVCIRHGIKGENAFLINETPDPSLIYNYISELFENDRVDACLCGWVEVMGSQFSSLVMLVEKNYQEERSATMKSVAPKSFKIEQINLLIKHN